MLRVIRTSSLLHYIVAITSIAAAMLLWPGLLPNLFAVGNGAEDFMTHSHCYLGIASLVRMHYYSDLLIGFSYVAISLALTYLVYRARRDIPFHWVFLAFGLFIIACGSTHFMEVWTTYREPYYWLAGYLKLITAVASVATALVLPPLIPRTLSLLKTAKLSDARREELEAANRELEVLYGKLRERDEKKMQSGAATVGAKDKPFAPIMREMEATLADLRETNQTLEAIIQASPLAIITLDREGIVQTWNSAAERIYGWSEQEVLGGPLPTVPPGKQEEMRRGHRQAMQGTAFKSLEAKRLRKDGTQITVSISTAPLSDANGQIKRVVALVEDITERKRAEEAAAFLNHATAMFASSLDYKATLEGVARLVVPDMADYCLVHMLEDDGTIRRMIVAHQDPAREKAWREMQRRFPLDMNTPHTIAKVLRTGRPEMFPEVSDELLESVIQDPEEARMLREFNIKATMIIPLRARGRTLGALTFISAESARRYTDEDFDLATELARRAALAIDNARLYLHAQEANQAKDEFLATLSHELRTPLTPIIGWVHMMSLGQLSPGDITHGLAIIGKNAQALAHLINDLLDMSAIMSGKMRIDTLPVSLDEVIKEAIETVRPQAAKQNIHIDLLPSSAGAPLPEGISVSGDRTRLVQVFWNLLTNAVKFSRADSVVRVICEVIEGSVRVHVEDEGEGITADFLPHVFERFRQQDMSTTKAYGGLGIGLALVKSFVDAHGGTVSATSAGEARGSRFTVSLPLFVRRAEALPAPSLTDAPVAETTREIEKAYHALIIEDAPDTLEMLRVAFDVRGFRTTICDTPEAALSIAASERFDIIISDIGLPNINGYELLSRLRSEAPYLRDVPALALTGYAAQKDVDAALAAGFSAHLAKPFDPAVLASTVDALVKWGKSEGITSNE